MKLYVLWGRKGDDAFDEQVLLEEATAARVAEVIPLAKAEGFGHFRQVELTNDLPDFVGALNLTKKKTVRKTQHTALSAPTAKERAAVAIRLIKARQTRSRKFSDCFEMGDGDDVIAEIVRRSRLDPVIERRYPRVAVWRQNEMLAAQRQFTYSVRGSH